MYVIGTAGHVDHGKSTLVQALTGIDPDRLREEKERGMTIDLGFAWLRLPSGEELSIVDVPGHQRFVNNMLAGVGGIDVALLVIAADESVMAQTREHIAILDLLRVDRGIVAITKSDLVDSDWMELVSADAVEVLKGTTLEGSPVVAVSGATGDGLAGLLSTIETLLHDTPIRKDLGRPRVPVDRSFTMSGFGTVVTGTLVDGSLAVGDQVELVPGGEKTRIRGLQTHQNKIDRATPGRRIAVNLTGMGHQRIARGDVLTSPGWLKPTSAMDVYLKVISDSPRPVRHNMFATVHTGSSETVARVRLLERDEAKPGESTWAQLKLDRPISAVKGDYYVIRSNSITLGGGKVVDPHARRHRRNYEPILQRLSLMERGSEREIILKSIESSEPSEFTEIVNRANLQAALAVTELTVMATERLIVIVGGKRAGPGAYIYSASGWSQVVNKTRTLLCDFHVKFPLRKGFPKEELRSRLGMTSQVFGYVMDLLIQENVLVDEGPVLRLPGHVQEVSEDLSRSLNEYLEVLESSPYSPPTDFIADGEVVNLLVDQGKVVKVSDNIVFSSSAYDHMVGQISCYIDEQGQISVADVRDLFGTSRKYALALLDHMDKQRITRRVGDFRVLR